MNTKPKWRTISIRINPKRKAVAIQAQFPLTPQEWDQLITSLDELKPQLVQERTTT